LALKWPKWLLRHQTNVDGRGKSELLNEVDRLGSGEDDAYGQYPQRGGQCGGSQTGLGDLNHGKLPSFATHNERPDAAQVHS
jgi:hypothetical protein